MPGLIIGRRSFLDRRLFLRCLRHTLPQLIGCPFRSGFHAADRLRLGIFRAGILPLLHLLTVLLFQQHRPMPGIEHGGTLAFRLSHFGLFLELRQISSPP